MAHGQGTRGLLGNGQPWPWTQAGRDAAAAAAGQGGGQPSTPAAPPALGGSASDIVSRLQGSNDPRVAIGETLNEGFRLRDIEDQRYGQTLGFMQDQFRQTNQPSMTQDTINQLYGREADRVNRGAMGDFSNLRTHLGGAGIMGGGLAAGLGAQIELSRLGQISGTRRDLTIAKAQSDANDRVRQWQSALGLGQQMNQSPSLLGLDTLGSAVNTSLGMYLGDKQVEAARVAGKAQQKAGKSSAAGSVIGGALGMI